MGIKHLRKIKEYLKKNDLMRYSVVCLKMCRDRQFRNKLISLYDTPDVLLFRHMGEENTTENIYMIYCDNPTRGFFSLFNLVLDGLQFADYYHMTPVVEWGPSTLFHEEGGIDGIQNSFEYYFKQPGGISVASARASQNVVFYEYVHRKLSIPHFNITVGGSLTDAQETEAYLAKRAEIIRKYIRFSDHVKCYLEDAAEMLVHGQVTLGVHVRGTDMHAGYNGHAKVVLPGDYLTAAKKAFSSGKFDKIFLATDEASVITLFEQEFGDRLIYFKDTLRSEDGQALHFSSSMRAHHQYQLGLEVLRDMYTLSICDGLIASISNVSLAARMMKKSYRKEYTHVEILSNGINHTNIKVERK